MLPTNLEPLDFDTRFRVRPELWLPTAESVCARHQLPFHDVTTFPDGSNLVAAVAGRYIVKIFPRFHRHQWESEHRVLEHLRGRAGITIPELVAHGELPDGWTYVIMSRLAGVTLESVWESCTREDKRRIMRRIGAIMAAVHALPVGSLHSLPPEWDGFVAAQRTGFLSRHSGAGMPQWFMAQAEEFVRSALPLLEDRSTRVVLTGEYTPFNLLVEGGPGRWDVCAMIDFGDAMVGVPDYDLLGPSLFLAAGDPERMQCLMTGYAEHGWPIGFEQRRRLMLLQILHRYSNFDAQLRLPQWRTRVSSIEALAELIWPCAEQRDIGSLK